MGKYLSIILKLIIATGLVYWIVKKGLLDLSVFQSLSFFAIIIGFLLVSANILLNNFRWTLLLRAREFQVSTRNTIPLTLIGLFFNFAMPGGVGGDLIKGYYLLQNQSHRKVDAIVSILVDRVIGLFTMGLMALVAIWFNYRFVEEHAELKTLMYFLIVFVVAVLVFIQTAFSEDVFEKLKEHLGWLPGKALIFKLYEAIHSFRHVRIVFLKAVAISVISQMTAITFFIFLNANIGGGEITPTSLFWIVPVGLIATSLPVSPGGIGVGQAVFLVLIKWVIGHDSTVGPNLITGYQITLLCIGLSGIYFYLKFKQSIRAQNAAR